MRRPLALLLALGPALPAVAHPHVFVEAQVALVVDAQNRLVAVDLSWTYHEYFSLLLTADLGVDLDGDGVLTGADEAALAAGVLDWPADFTGDLQVTAGGTPLALSAPEAQSVAYENGVVIERHRRPLVEPVPTEEAVAVQVFDPFYYVAYTIVGETRIEGGTNCAATYEAADLNAAYALVDELLYGRPASGVGPMEEFPEVGNAFADTIRLTCAASG